MRVPTHILHLPVAILLCLFLPSLHANNLQSLNYLTETAPPYNFKTDNKLQGIAVDLLIESLKQLKQPLNPERIRLLPWARAYKLTQTGTNTVLFSTARTKEREKQFKWVGPISSSRIVLMAHISQNIKINSVADIKKYNVGSIRQDVGGQLVESLKLVDSEVIPANNVNSLIKMLTSNRIQLWATEENIGRWSIKQANLSSAAFETVYVLQESSLYYAFSKDVDDELLQQLQEGLESLKNTQGPDSTTLYHEIMGRYL